jgi:hypothetical protein
MATISTNRYALRVVDQTKELQEHSIGCTPFTSINFTAQEGFLLAYKGAVEGIIVGNVAVEIIYAGIDTEDPLPVPADGSAQAEMDWAIKVQDSVTKKFSHFRIATPDMVTTAMRKSSSNRADLTHASWVAYKTAYDAVARSEANNPSTFEDAVLFGRAARLTANTFAAVK